MSAPGHDSPNATEQRLENEEFARRWLSASHGENLYLTEVYDRVLELTATDLDPARGWDVVKALIRLADTDDELWRIGEGPLNAVVREHPNLVSKELRWLLRTDPKYRQVFAGQISEGLRNFLTSADRCARPDA
jgi:hypothetical protein